MANPAIFVTVGATAEPAKGVLRDLQGSIDAFSVAGVRSLENVGDSVKKLTSTLRSEGRIGAFWAGEVAQMVGATGEAKGALKDLGGVAAGLLTGGAIGAALAAINGVLSLVKQAAEDGERAIKEADTVVDSVLKRWDARIKELNRELIELRGGKAAAEAADAKADLDSINAKILELRFKRANQSEGLFSRRGNTDKEIDKLLNERVIAQQKMDRAAAAQKEIDAEVERKAEERFADEEETWKVRRAEEAGRKEAEAEAKSYDTWMRALKAQKPSTDYVGNGMESPAAGAAGLAATQERERMEAAKALTQQMTLEGTNVVKQYTAMGKASDFFYNKKFELDNKDQEEVKRAAERYAEYGQKVGETMAEVAEGHKSMGQAIREMLAEVLKALIEYAIQSITAHMLGTEATVVEQNASQGPYGWLIGIAAAGAVGAFFEGLIGNLGSAASGYEVPWTVANRGSGGMPLMVHGGEGVLPADVYQPLKRGLQEGGGMGSTTHNHFHITAMDAQSFEDHLKRRGGDAVLNRWAIRQAQRSS